MSGVINTLGIISGMLGGAIFLFSFVGIQGARGLGELILGVFVLSVYACFSVGGFGCLSLQNWARRLLLIGSALIILLLCVYAAWNIINKNPDNWGVVSYVILSVGLIIPLGNIYIFTRPKVKAIFIDRRKAFCYNKLHKKGEGQ